VRGTANSLTPLRRLTARTLADAEEKLTPDAQSEAAHKRKIKMIKQLTSNTSYFIVCEATIYLADKYIKFKAAACQTYLGGRRYNDKSECINITKWKQFKKQITTDTKTKQSTVNFFTTTEQRASTNCHTRR
jgi:hypothetical protein